MSLQPPFSLFKCWWACLCECKVALKKNSVLREDGAEQGGHACASVGSCEIKAAFCATMGRNRATLNQGRRGFPDKQRGQLSLSGVYLPNIGISQFESFGSWPKLPETGPKSIGIDLCGFVGTAPGILGFGFGADLRPKSAVSGRILKQVAVLSGF